MLSSTILVFAIQFSILIGAFMFFLVQAIWLGRQAIVNLTIGLFLATILFSQLVLFEIISRLADTYIYKIILFSVCFSVAFFLIKRLMPGEYQEGHFESFFKKLLLAAAGTISFTYIIFIFLRLETVFTNSSTLILQIFDTPFTIMWLLITGIILWYAS